jgi:periplasmic protein TonB
MAKYRMLFLLISIIIWSGILYGVSKVRPHIVTDFLDNLNVVKAEKEKKLPPPPPPPPPPEKLPPPPPLVERQTKIIVDIPPPPVEEIRETVVRAPPPPAPALTDYQPPAPPPPPPAPPPPPPPSCTEGAKNPRKLRDFNVERAYPQRAVDRGTEGSVRATLQIDATGSVVGVIVTSANPPGVFESAVEREARRMRFEPARRNCENVADDYPLEVKFVLGE